MTDNKKFTVRIPEQYIDFEFKVYADETIEDLDVLEALDEKAWNEVYESTPEIEVYDEHGFQIAIPSASVTQSGDESISGEEAGGDAPGNYTERLV